MKKSISVFFRTFLKSPYEEVHPNKSLIIFH